MSAVHRPEYPIFPYIRHKTVLASFRAWYIQVAPHLMRRARVQMCRGLNSAERAQFGIPEGDQGVATFAYLAQSGCISIPGTDDARDFQEVKRAMATVGIDAFGQAQIWQLLSGTTMHAEKELRLGRRHRLLSRTVTSLNQLR